MIEYLAYLELTKAILRFAVEASCKTPEYPSEREIRCLAIVRPQPLDLEAVDEQVLKTFARRVVEMRRIAVHGLKEWPIDITATARFKQPVNFVDDDPGFGYVFKDGAARNSVKRIGCKLIGAIRGNNDIGGQRRINIQVKAIFVNDVAQPTSNIEKLLSG